MISTIAARRLIGAGGTVEYPLVTIEDGRISRIETLTASEHEGVGATYRFPEATLVPAYVDIHIHGCAGHDVMEATPEALRTIGAYLASRGVGAYFPTTVTSPR
jgi:N-acetylglucosamine-6-phosphate deacetylase